MTTTPLELLTQVYEEISHVVAPVYMVGGCVRDALLNIQPHDFDGATPLHPHEVEDCVRAAGRRPFLVGKRFGTIGFKACGHHVEVTTFRNESYHPQNRKPDVSFVSCLKTDLSRRDFTINALAFDGSIIDPYNGQYDLDNRILRCVGSPTQRFSEDPLRMVRGARFVAQLGLTVESTTADAMSTQASQILTVAIERIMMELDKLLAVSNLAACVQGVTLLHRTQVLPYLVPELFAWESDKLTDTFMQLTNRITHLMDARCLNEVVPDHLYPYALRHITCDQRWLGLLALAFHTLMQNHTQRLVDANARSQALQPMFDRYIERWGRSLRMSTDRIKVLQQYALLCGTNLWDIPSDGMH